MAAEKLKDDELVVFREAFGKFDPEESNHVATENIGNVLRAAGQAPTEAQLEEYKKELDSKDSGEVEFQALADLFAKIIKSSLDMDDELNAAFRVLDKDLDGVISASEIREYLTTLGDTLSHEEIDEFIKDGDTSGEGKINYTEYCFAL
uniref:calmodulin-like n=1 Tax=Styela clava TaxID=7725 RepID=UPI00193A8103|nr:calmodulin-like [Styela clava]